MNSADADPREPARDAPSVPPEPPPFDPDLALITELEKGVYSSEDKRAAG